MSYIDSINQASTASTTTTDSASSGDAASLGKQDFLTLLVAQLQNQDPLNPDDPTEFTAQLAQFSSLEQLFNLNDSMNNMAATVENSDRLSALQTIGKEVAYNGSNFSYDGSPVQVGYQLDGTASEVQLYLQKDGTTVAILEGTDLSAGTHYLTWNGLAQGGEAAPVGEYTVVIQAKAAEGDSIAASPVVRAEVTGVDLSDSYGGTLITESGAVSFTSILGIYDKNGTAPDTTTGNNTTPEEDTDESIIDEATDLVTDTQEFVDESETLIDQVIN